MDNERYTEETKKQVVKAVLDGRAQGKTWKQCLEDTRRFGFRSKLGALKQFMYYYHPDVPSRSVPTSQPDLTEIEAGIEAIVRSRVKERLQELLDSLDDDGLEVPNIADLQANIIAETLTAAPCILPPSVEPFDISGVPTDPGIKIVECQTLGFEGEGSFGPEKRGKEMIDKDTPIGTTAMRMQSQWLHPN
jgi:hypothetical protein